MSLPRKIFYNTLAQSAGKLFAAAIGVITIAILTRHLKDAGFGQYATIVAFLGFFATLAELGLYLIVTREISKPDTDRKKIISNALGLRLTASLVLLAAGVLISLLLPYDALVKKTMVIGAAALLFMSLNQVLVGVFQKHLVQHLLTVSETAGRLLNLLLIWLAISSHMSLPFLIGALVAANMLTFGLSVRFARRYEKFGIAFDMRQWRKLLSSSWPLIFAIVLNLVYFRADTVILSAFHDAAAVGVYSFPYKNLEGLLAFPAMFVGLIMPLLSRTAGADWPRFKLYLQNAFNALAIMAAPVVIVTLFFAGPILEFLSGHQAVFADSAALMQILIIAVAMIFFGTLFGYAVVAVNKQKAMIAGYLLAAAAALIIYFGFIPSYSYWAAAWGTVASELVVLVYAYALVRKASGQSLSFLIFAKLLPAAILMAGFYWLAQINWFAELLIGAALYAAALIIFKIVPVRFAKELFFLSRQ